LFTLHSILRFVSFEQDADNGGKVLQMFCDQIKGEKDVFGSEMFPQNMDSVDFPAE
jgi:hypothetical protein